MLEYHFICSFYHTLHIIPWPEFSVNILCAPPNSWRGKTNASSSLPWPVSLPVSPTEHQMNMCCMKVKVLIAQTCPTLCNPVDCRPPGFSVYGISQARILEWVSISFSRGSSRPRDRTWVSRIAGRRFNFWATREAHQIQEITAKSNAVNFLPRIYF